MKRHVFIIAAAAGLTCGFFVNAWTQERRDSSGLGQAISNPDLQAGFHSSSQPTCPAGDWESRISSYLNAAPSAVPPPVDFGGNARAEADWHLHLLRCPVNADSIREGVAFLNASDPLFYYAFMVPVFERWARRAPGEALAAALDLRFFQAKGALVWKVFQAAKGDPELLAKALAQPAGIIRSAAFASIADGVTPDQLPEILRQYVREQSPEFQRQCSFPDVLLRRLSKLDPKLPLQLALATDDPSWRTWLLENDPNGMASDQFAALLKEPRNVEGVASHMIWIMGQEPTKWLKLLNEFPEANRPKLMRDGVALAVGGMHSKDSAEIARAGIEKREGLEGFRAILADASLTWGAFGLVETAKWLESRQDAAGLDDLTRRATSSEPHTTARWLSTLPPSAGRDRAVAIFAETHAAIDLERAATWAESITDASLREKTLTTLRKPIEGE